MTRWQSQNETVSEWDSHPGGALLWPTQPLTTARDPRVFTGYFVGGLGKMGRRGTKPKPVEAHKLAGSYKASRHKTSDVASGNADLPCPPEVTGDAAVLWCEMVPKLNAARLVETLDSYALASMCRWYASWHLLMQQLEQAQADGEDSKIHRLLIQASIADKQWRSVATKLGLTPSDRQSMRHNAAGEKKENPILKILKERAS